VELRAAFLAEYFRVDTDTGNFTVAGGFTSLTADVFPAALKEMGFLVIVVDGDGGEPDPGLRINIRVKGVEPLLASNTFPLKNFPEAKPDAPVTQNLRVALNELVLPGPGTYYFDIHLGERLVQSLRLIAALAKPEEQP
jgi:hypothetical protein